MTWMSVLHAELAAALSDSRALRWHGSVLVTGLAGLVLSWRSEDLAFFLGRGQGPGILGSVVLAGSLLLFGLAGAVVLDRVHGESVHPFLHWCRYTPVRWKSYLAGRIAFHMIHTLLLILALLPALMGAAVGSWARPGDALILAAFLGLTSFGLRSGAEAMRHPDRPAGSLAYLIWILVFIGYLLLSASTLPEWSLIHALRNLADPANPAGSVVTKTAALFLALGLGGSSIAAWRLRRSEKVEGAP